MTYLVIAPRLMACKISVFNTLSVLMNKSAKGSPSRAADILRPKSRPAPMQQVAQCGSDTDVTSSSRETKRHPGRL